MSRSASPHHHPILSSLPVLIVALLLGSCGDDDSPVDAGADAAVDGGTCVATASDFPAPAAGLCQASILDSEATLATGDDGAGGYIIPGGHRLTPVGDVIELPGFPMHVVPIPGTSFVVVSDGGIGDEALSVVDIDSLTVVDQASFRGGAGSPEALFLGLAIRSDGQRLWASGGGSNRVWAFDVDPATGQITPAPARDITLATDISDGYVAGIALLGDDHTLVANLLHGDQLVVYDTDAGTEVRRVPFDSGTFPYDVVPSPDDSTAFVSLWNGAAVAVVNLASGTTSTIAVGKNPEGLALSPDGTRLVVANSDSDSLSVIDVATRVVVDTLWVAGEDALRGASPSAGAFDAAGRLYVVNAGDNAVDVFAPNTGGLSQVGRIPTMWYPTDVRVLSDGRVVVLNGKHVGTGPNTTPGMTDIVALLGGSITVLDGADVTDAALRDWETQIAINNDRAARFETVDCPSDAAYDFPVPLPGAGPSTLIEHVIVVVRENKTHDAYFGNLTTADGMPHGDGDPALTLIPPDEMDQVLPNTRELARRFGMADNYYSLAEQSIQGHILTTHGRTTDFVERTWLTTWGREYWTIPPQGIVDPLGYAEEGSIFDWFTANSIELSNYGEVVAARAAGPRAGYPGLVYNIDVKDIDKAEWLSDQWQRRCSLRTFTYVVMPNDHTYGGRAGKPTPRSMIADNDEGVGRLVDGLSHSTWWPTSVVFVIEDDPQDGGDHVDNHRSPLVVISPWVRRGHVASVHYNESSIYRTIQLILGIDQPLNAYWANASPMYDVFTSTPDYTPYDYIPRRWPEETNPGGGSMAALSASWDFSAPDQQPGLSRMLWRHLRGTEPPWPIRPEVVAEAIRERARDEGER